MNHMLPDAHEKRIGELEAENRGLKTLLALIRTLLLPDDQPTVQLISDSLFSTGKFSQDESIAEARRILGTLAEACAVRKVSSGECPVCHYHFDD